MDSASLQRVLGPFIRVQLLAYFSRWIAMGYLTPENASTLVQWIMDGLAFGVPLVYGLVAAYWAKRSELIKTTNALPGVLGVAVTPELDSKINEATVTTPEKLVDEIRKQ